MAKPKGSPKTGGRRAGTPNKATAEIKDIARVHGPAAIAELWKLAKGAESDAAKVAALKEILDRGYGKATQPLEHGGTLLEEMLERLSARSTVAS